MRSHFFRHVGNFTPPVVPFVVSWNKQVCCVIDNIWVRIADLAPAVANNVLRVGTGKQVRRCVILLPILA